jgi:hypothetical protein
LQLVDLGDENGVHELYGANYVLVRPDGHVAWRGDAPPANAGHVLDVVRGVTSVQGSATANSNRDAMLAASAE